MRYMIFEYKYLEYGKIFGDLMDLLEVIVYSIYLLDNMGDIWFLFFYKLENKEELWYIIVC